MTICVAVVALAAVCVAMRITAPLLLGERRPPARLDSSLGFAVPALLAALVVTGTLVEGQRVVLDPRLAGVAAATAIAAARGPLLAAVVAAAVVTAGLRAL
jgi:branched-subunit amino acid transport protein